MYSRWIKHKGDKRSTEYRIYTKKEADDLGVDYVYWQKIDRSGVWAISDDDIVAQVILFKIYESDRKKINYYYRFPYGNKFAKPKYFKTTKLLAKGRKTASTLSGEFVFRNGKMPKRREEILRNLAFVYTQCFNRDLTIAIVTGGCSKSQHQLYTNWTYKERFYSMVREDLKVMLDKEGMDEVYTLKLLKSGIEMAKSKKDVTNILKAVQNLEKLNDMLEDNTGVYSQRKIAIQETRLLMDKLNEEEVNLNNAAIERKGEISEISYTKDEEE